MAHLTMSDLGALSLTSVGNGQAVDQNGVIYPVSGYYMPGDSVPDSAISGQPLQAYAAGVLASRAESGDIGAALGLGPVLAQLKRSIGLAAEKEPRVVYVPQRKGFFEENWLKLGLAAGAFYLAKKKGWI